MHIEIKEKLKSAILFSNLHPSTFFEQNRLNGSVNIGKYIGIVMNHYINLKFISYQVRNEKKIYSQEKWKQLRKEQKENYSSWKERKNGKTIKNRKVK